MSSTSLLYSARRVAAGVAAGAGESDSDVLTRPSCRIAPTFSGTTKNPRHQNAAGFLLFQNLEQVVISGLVRGGLLLLFLLLGDNLSDLLQIGDDLAQVTLVARPIRGLEFGGIRAVPLNGADLAIELADGLVDAVNRLLDLGDQVLHVLGIITEERFSHENHLSCTEPRNFQRSPCPIGYSNRTTNKNL